MVTTKKGDMFDIFDGHLSIFARSPHHNAWNVKVVPPSNNGGGTDGGPLIFRVALVKGGWARR